MAMRPNFSCFFKFTDLMKQIHDEYAGLGIRSFALLLYVLTLKIAHIKERL